MKAPKETGEYLDTSGSYLNAEVYAAIYIGGAIRYDVRKGAGVDDP